MPYMLLIKYNEFGDWHVYTRSRDKEPMWFDDEHGARMEGFYLIQQNVTREFIVVQKVE